MCTFNWEQKKMTFILWRPAATGSLFHASLLSAARVLTFRNAVLSTLRSLAFYMILGVNSCHSSRTVDLWRWRHYCLLPKRMQLTCTAWVESLNTRDVGRGKIYRSCQKHESLTAWCSFLTNTSRHLLCVPFVTSLKSNLWTALNT